MTEVWLLVAMFTTGPLHYEVYASRIDCEAQVARFAKSDTTIAYCTARVVVPRAASTRMKEG